MSTLSVQSITGVSSFDFSNTTFANAYNVANSGYVVANSVFSQSNSEVTRLSAAYVVANASFTYGNSSYTVANAAFGKANNALPLSGGTMSGNINVGSNYLYVPHTGTTSGAGNTSVSAVKFGSYGRLQHTSLNNVPFLSWNAELFRSDFTGSGTGGPDYNTFRPDYAAGYYGFMSSSNGGFAFNVGPWSSAANTTINDFAGHSSYAGGFDASKNWIVANGKIGIGTSSPAYLLDIDQGTNDSQNIRLKNEEVSLFFGTYGTGSSYPREVTINGSRADAGSLPNLRIAGQGGIKFCVDFNTERMVIDSSGRVRMPYQPVFVVSFTGSSSLSFTSGQKFTFNAIKTDIGSNFSTTNNRYTAPVAGSYKMTASFHINTNPVYCRPVFRVNGTDYFLTSDQAQSIMSVTGAELTMILDCILVLNAGDYVEIFSRAGSSTTQFYVGHSWWSGYLIG